MHIPFVVNHTINTTPPERLQQNHLWIFKFETLFDHTASHNMVQIKHLVCHSLKQHPPGSIADAFWSAVPIIFSLALILATFVLVVVVACFNS